MYIESGIWTTLLHRLASMLYIQSTSDLSHSGVVETTTVTRQSPDWSLISSNGLFTFACLALGIFTKVSRFHSLPLAPTPTSIHTLTEKGKEEYDQINAFLEKEIDG